MTAATIRIWGLDVGAVVWDTARNLGIIEFSQGFIDKSIDLAPITMPLERLRQGERIYSFPGLSEITFKKLPGLLADSLPDSFGNKLIDLWLTQKGRSFNDFTPVERLCYVGSRGMGALEFEPSIFNAKNDQDEIQLQELVQIAQEIMDEKTALNTQFGKDDQQALRQIIQVGTSAGGMRPKAIIAIDHSTQKILSGYINAPKGYDYWILKFDGVQDTIFGKPQEYGIIEYVYYLLAQKCGILMSECKLLHENGRSHFMTKRFDRQHGEKIHMQTLTGLAHFDFNNIGSTSYEQVFQIMRRLRLGHDEMEQMYRRMVFNIVARNQDDHPKNISFLLENGGEWKLAPAYDMTYSYNPNVASNTNRHQMSVNGKREKITRSDLIHFAEQINLKNANTIIDEVVDAVLSWEVLAKDNGLSNDRIIRVAENLNLGI